LLQFSWITLGLEIQEYSNIHIYVLEIISQMRRDCLILPFSEVLVFIFWVYFCFLGEWIPWAFRSVVPEEGWTARTQISDHIDTLRSFWSFKSFPLRTRVVFPNMLYLTENSISKLPILSWLIWQYSYIWACDFSAFSLIC
jgi:hypothetical protein